MTTEHEKDIFCRALELGPSEREAFLDDACAGDEAMRSRIAGLIDAHEDAHGFMAAPTAESSVQRGEAFPSEQPGTHVGAYELIEILGEGGFGRVFLAQQHPTSNCHLTVWQPRARAAEGGACSF